MKNKKYLVSLFVLVALLCLGIGYAAVSKDLNIAGLGTTYGENVTDPNNPDPVDKDDTTDLGQNFKVHFDSVATAEASDTANTTCSVTVVDDLNATITANKLLTLYSKVTVTLTIVNDSEDLDAVIDLPVITNDNETYYRVTTDWVKTTLAPHASKTVVVTIECIKSAIDHQVTNFGIKFTANAELHA